MAPEAHADDASSFNRADASCRREAPASRAKRSAVVSRATRPRLQTTPDGRREPHDEEPRIDERGSQGCARAGVVVLVQQHRPQLVGGQGVNGSARHIHGGPQDASHERLPAAILDDLAWHPGDVVGAAPGRRRSRESRRAERQRDGRRAPDAEDEGPGGLDGEERVCLAGNETRKHPKPAPTINRIVPRMDVTRRHPLRCRGAAGGARGPRPSAGWRTGDRRSIRSGR